MIFTRRGIQKSRGYRVTTGFPFGLFEKTLLIDAPHEVLVYPKIHRVWNVDSGAIVAGDALETRRKGEGPALHSLRGYRPGDDSRSIHWKISARHARLYVKENEQEDERKVQIWLSNRAPFGPSSKAFSRDDFEEAVSLSASLVLNYSQKGYTVGFCSLDREFLPRQGLAHCHKILRHLARIEPRDDLNPESVTWFSGRTSTRSQQVILILPWDDPFWKGLRAPLRQIITPAQWKGERSVRKTG